MCGASEGATMTVHQRGRQYFTRAVLFHFLAHQNIVQNTDNSTMSSSNSGARLNHQAVFAMKLRLHLHSVRH